MSFFREHPRIILGPGDDALVLSEIPSRALVISVDAQKENVHFSRNFINLREIGHRALAAALSDLAAMAAEPLTYIVNLELPKDLGEKGAREIYEGFEELNKKYCISPSGGNVVRGDRISLTITVIGEVARERVITRDGFKEGDLLVITGDLGRSFAGYKIVTEPRIGEKLDSEEKTPLKEKFLVPMPRITEMLTVAKEIDIHAAIDISDGLGLDLFRAVRSTEFEIIVHSEKLPIYESVKKFSKCIGIPDWKLAVSSGEEFEVAFFISKNDEEKLKLFDFPLTVIGEVRASFKPDVKIKIGSEEFSIAGLGYDQLRV